MDTHLAGWVHDGPDPFEFAITRYPGHIKFDAGVRGPLRSNRTFVSALFIWS